MKRCIFAILRLSTGLKRKSMREAEARNRAEAQKEDEERKRAKAERKAKKSGEVPRQDV